MKRLIFSIQLLGIISIAAFAGAMIMLYTSLVSFWEQIPAEDFFNWYSNYSSGIEATTGPLVMLSLFLPLLAILLVRKIPQSRIYWLISFLLCIGIMAITLSYFVEANTSFATRSIEAAHLNESIHRWGDLHLLRISMALISAVFAGIGLLKYLSNSNED
ncbi:MAG: anthrone oxygenase family protein [Bacteroidia bacterium]|nr:anthrone oxygenase family protein [Bacteroidia bacterium]